VGGWGGARGGNNVETRVLYTHVCAHVLRWTRREHVRGGLEFRRDRAGSGGRSGCTGLPHGWPMGDFRYRVDSPPLKYGGSAHKPVD